MALKGKIKLFGKKKSISPIKKMEKKKLSLKKVKLIKY